MYNVDLKEEMDAYKLQQQLEKQYGPAMAQGIIDSLKKTKPVVKTPEYMDVKAMSELQERFRAQAMMAVWKLKQWRKSQNSNPVTANLIQLEGAFLQRQCEDAVKLYRHANKRYFAMYREAMAAFINTYQEKTLIRA